MDGPDDRGYIVVKWVPVVKRLRRKVYLSPPCSAEVNNGVAVLPHSPVR
jgi:hypothetical protein